MKIYIILSHFSLLGILFKKMFYDSVSIFLLFSIMKAIAEIQIDFLKTVD